MVTTKLLPATRVKAEAAAALYVSGMPIDEIANKMFCTRQAVHYWFRALSVSVHKNRKKKSPGVRVARVGERFGRLTVVSVLMVNGVSCRVVRCDCGSPEKTIALSNIRRVSSCGCFRIERSTEAGRVLAAEAEERANARIRAKIKRCRRCGEGKQFESFHKNSSCLDGVDSMCKSCHSADHQNNRHKASDYYARPEIRERIRSNRSRNIGKLRAYYSARRALCRKAFPDWCDKKAIEEVYSNKPEGCHVDHIVPLISDVVCGLHVPWNMQYLPASENSRKGNRYWPDMPEQE